MARLCEEFSRLCNASEISPETLRVLEAMTRIYDGMKMEVNDEYVFFES
jgi:hypothetical protein